MEIITTEGPNSSGTIYSPDWYRCSDHEPNNLANMQQLCFISDSRYLLGYNSGASIDFTFREMQIRMAQLVRLEHVLCCIMTPILCRMPLFYPAPLSSIGSALADQFFERLLVVPGNHLSSGRSLQLFQALCAAEPSRMVSCQPTLWDAITPLNPTVSSAPLEKARILTFSITWQWSLMKRKVPLSGMLICIPINPVGS